MLKMLRANNSLVNITRLNNIRRSISKYVPYQQSSTETVFVSEEMDKNLNFAEWAPQSNKLFSLKARFVPPSEFQFQLPKNNLPEFAFVGRSNVGKSSLIAALLNERKEVKISKSPGCTKSVNYYAFLKNNTSGETSSHAHYLVDLPGYGYAKISKSEQMKWKEVIDGYLQSRDFTVLRRVYVLIDSRHGIKQSDITMLKSLSAARLPSQIILTKSDLCSPVELHQSLSSIFKVILSDKKFLTCLPIVHVVCSKLKEEKGCESKSDAKFDDGLVHLKRSMAEIIEQNYKSQSTAGFQTPV